MSKTRKVYSESFRMQVVSNYYSGGCHLSETARKWEVPIPTLQKWVKTCCLGQEKSVPLPAEEQNAPIMETTESDTIAALQKRINELETSLAYERLRVVAYERLIEIASKEEGIDVLKKAGAKQ